MHPGHRALPAVALAITALATTAAVPAAAASDFPAGYRAHHTFTEMRDELRSIAAAHPHIVRLTTLGRSHDGRRLFVLKVSDNVALDESEPEIYVDGGIHGREHLSTEQALALIHWLVDDYGADDRVSAIVDSTETWIAPMVNPDGATHDVSGGEFRHWRKNRQPNADGSFGTDINRNFGYRWAGPGSSGDPSDDFYRGRKAWSTPEARHIRDFVRGRIVGGEQQLGLALTLHSHGEFVMYPFGWTSDPLPSDMRATDREALASLAAGIAARNGYRDLQAGALYRSSGTFMDWAYARQGIYALTLELSPPANVNGGWYVADPDVSALLERNRDALLWFLEQALLVD